MPYQGSLPMRRNTAAGLLRATTCRQRQTHGRDGEFLSYIIFLLARPQPLDCNSQTASSSSLFRPGCFPSKEGNDVMSNERDSRNHRSRMGYGDIPAGAQPQSRLNFPAALILTLLAPYSTPW